MGSTLLHEFVDDDARGQVFAAVHTMIRFCLLLALAAALVLAGVFDKVARGLVSNRVAVTGLTVGLPACASPCGSVASSPWWRG